MQCVDSNGLLDLMINGSYITHESNMLVIMIVPYQVQVCISFNNDYLKNIKPNSTVKHMHICYQVQIISLPFYLFLLKASWKKINK